MPKKEDNFDKTFLVLSALLAVGGVAGLFYLKGGLPELLKSSSSTPKAEFPEVPLEKAQKANDQLLKSFTWEAPVIEGKPIPLNKSVPVIMQGGELFDLFLETKQLRPPMTNAYLRQNELEYLAPNVGDLDPDADGFSNLEEFVGKTNPRDAKSTPAVETKLYFVRRVQDDYILKLRNREMPLQVGRIKPAPKNIFIDTLPKPFNFEPGAATMRFEAKALEMVKNGEIETPQLKIYDTATQQELTLVYNVENNLAEYQAEMEFRLKTVTPLKVKKGETFYLPNVGTKYQLLDVQEGSATVAPVSGDKPGPSFEIKPR
jgi:hypothetical protein